MAGENISARFVLPTVASSVDIVVHLTVDADGKRRVREIVAVPGRVESDVIETESLFHAPQGRLIRGEGMPSRLDRFAQAGIDVHALLARSSGQRLNSADGRPAYEPSSSESAPGCVDGVVRGAGAEHGI